MKQNLDDLFEEFQQAAIEDAEQVKCSLPDFLEGLQTMKAHLELRILCVTDEVKKMEDDDA